MIKQFVCKAELDKIADYEVQIQSLDNEISELNGEVAKLQSTITSDKQTLQIQIDNYIKQVQTLTQQKVDLEKQVNDLKSQSNPIPADVQTLIKTYYDKYPPADITYTGRYIGKDIGNTYALDVKIFAQAGQNDYVIKNFLVQNRCTLKQVMEDKPNLTYHQACDETVLRVCHLISVNYYFDDQTYGVGEFWAFAFELFYLKKGDCEDHCYLRYVACRIAGVSEGLLRINCGYTRRGEGHSTFYYLKSDSKWYHINSTSQINTFADWKLNDDASDNMGLKEVWFSFNEECAWHTFKTDAAKNSYYKDDYSKRIKIVPKAWVK